MRRNLSYMFRLLAVLPLFTSCIDDVFDKEGVVGGMFGKDDVSYSAVHIGYDPSLVLDKVDHVQQGRLVYLSTREELDDLIARDPESGADTVNVMSFNTGVYPVHLRVSPEDALVRSWSLVSSDTTIVRVTDRESLGMGRTQGPDEAVLQVVGVGDCRLTLSVTGRGDACVEIPVRAVATTTLRFRCTPFWLGKIVTRIHWRCREVPSNVKDVVFRVTDSIRVIGEVRYYDHRLHGPSEQVLRDTVAYPAETFHKRFKKDTYHMLRNVSSAVRELSSRKTYGTQLRWDMARQEYDTVDTYYRWKAVAVDCLFGIVSDNPYLQFDYESKPGRTYDTADKDGGVADSGSDGEDTEEGLEEETEDIGNYFRLLLNDGLTDAQRDSIRNEVNMVKKDLGYDADNLTEAQRDSLLVAMDREREEKL